MLSELQARLQSLGAQLPAPKLAALHWTDEQFIDRHLVQLSERLIEVGGAALRLAPDHEVPGREVQRWRWTSLVAPPDLLVAARTPTSLSNLRRIQVLDPTLRIIEPVAHLHVHASAVLPFSRLWDELGASLNLARVRTAPDGFSLPHWRAWVSRAFLGRKALSVWLRNGRPAFEDFALSRPEVGQALKDLCAGSLPTLNRPSEWALEGQVRRYFSKAMGTRNPNRPLPELAFQRACIEFLSTNANQPLFRKLWSQCTRIWIVLYRHLVHDPASSGLDEFVGVFSRLSEYYVDISPQDVVSEAIDDSDLDLEVVELRRAPAGAGVLRQMDKAAMAAGSGSSEQRAPAPPLRQMNKAATSATGPTVRWILHFIRDRDCANGGVRGMMTSLFKTGHQLAITFRQQPRLLRTIRALDVASSELKGPLWCSAAPLHLVREGSRQIAATTPGIPALSLTLHVGEDFSHLIGGLRAIHEPFWWRMMRRGDRLGHALALGIDPGAWCESNPIVLVHRVERMLDLAWLLSFVSDRGLTDAPHSAITEARTELAGHLRSWDEDESCVPEFISMARHLGNPRLWAAIDAPRWKPGHFHRKSHVLRLLGKFLAAFSRDPREVVEVHVRAPRDAVLLTAVRDELARVLSMWRTPIELNPSSNLLIGNLAYPLAQPLFQIDGPSDSSSRGVVLTLSADDPVCFGTSLADEFAYTWAGLTLGAGKSAAFAQEWLDRVARASRVAAFDRPRKSSESGCHNPLQYKRL